MNNMLDMIKAVANEKGMPVDLVRSAMEAAIASWVRREQKAPDGTFVVTIHPESGEVRTARTWVEVPDEESLTNPQAERVAGDGVLFEEELPEPTWNRQGLQVVKQVLYQRIKQGLRATIAEAWMDRMGTIVRGVVKRSDRRVIVDLGEPVEGLLGPRDLIKGEHFRVGDRIGAVVTDVNAEGHGPVVTLSRTADAYVRELVAQEVPEIELGLVILKNVVREPGSRAKVAVAPGPGLRGSAPAICAGSRGVRAQAISSEINGERLDFIPWTENQVDYILAALAPAEVSDLIVDEDEHRVWIGVESDKLARAIGTRGQNVRLAARLTGWMMEIMSSEELAAKREAEDEQMHQTLKDQIDADDNLAEALISSGFETIEDIFLAKVEDLMEIDGFDEELAAMVKERADAAVSLNQLEATVALQDPNDLSHLTALTETDHQRLTEQGITGLQDLADQATDDLEWPSREKQRLADWIMEARRLTGMLDEPAESNEETDASMTA